LWKVIAYVYTREFLQGLFDGDGTIGIGCSKKHLKASVFLTNSNIELLKYAKKLLLGYGIKSQILPHIARKIRMVNGKPCIRKKKTMRLYIYSTEKFKEIGFKIRRKQEKLIDVLYILDKYGCGKRAVKEWKKTYQKVNNRWIKR